MCLVMLKNGSEVCEVNSKELRHFQVDTVLKIDASFRSTQSWKLTHLSGWHSLENWRIFSEQSGSMFEEGKQQLSAISFKPYSEKWRIFRMIFYIKRQMTAFLALKKKNILVIWKYLLFKNVGDFPFSVRRVYANVSFKGF